MFDFITIRIQMFSQQNIISLLKIAKTGFNSGRVNYCSVCYSLNLKFSSFNQVERVAPSYSFLLQDASRDISKLQARWYAKSKDKKGKVKKIHISDEEMSELINVEGMREDFKKAVDRLKEDYFSKLSIRTSLGSLEQISVNFDGEKYPINEIAQVVRKSPTMVVINATISPSAAGDILKALKTSGMNLNPQIDGSSIFVPLPKVTREYREGLAKNAKVVCEKSKTVIRDVGSKYVRKANMPKEGVSDDTVFKTVNKIDEIASEYQAEAEVLMKNKQNEIMQVDK